MSEEPDNEIEIEDEALELASGGSGHYDHTTNSIVFDPITTSGGYTIDPGTGYVTHSGGY